MTELRIRVGPLKIRIPDVAMPELPLPDEEVLTSARFGVPNVWAIDPWKHRGWRVNAQGWATVADGIMRTADGKVAMPLTEVLLP